MRPNGEELLKGVQQTLTTYVLPELQTPFARTELMLALTLLGIAASDWDGAAQRLVDDNDALRELARRGADALSASEEPGSEEIASELRTLADETTASLLVSELSASNARLRAGVGTLASRLERADAPAMGELRGAVIDYLREDAESRSRSLLGPRADG